MIAGLILGLALGLCIAMLVYITMDSKMLELRNTYAKQLKSSAIKWHNIK